MSYEAGKATREHEKTLYSRLLGYLSEVEIAGVKATGEQIIDAAGGLDQLPQYKLMVAYGGGKDSTYVVAFVRAVQLYLQDSFDRTFVMRVANMRHAGVPQSVMDNIDRVYRALGLLEDERVELITVDHTLIRPFQRVLPLPERMIAINRVDVLMNGHRSAGDGRPTFCNSCNLSVADFYGRAAWWQGGVDAVVTGDSRREQLLYSAWILRLAKASGIDVEQCRKMGFQGLLIALRGIGDAYFRELFGDDAEAELSEREVSTGGRSVQPEFISIYDHVSYRVHDHWDLIVDFLGFQFDDLAFSFSESDCANPNLMAHLRGLRTQYVQNRTYEDGITEYLHLGKELMEKKEMPEHLAQLVLDRYDSPEKMGQRRRLSADFARDAFGLEELAARRHGLLAVHRRGRAAADVHRPLSPRHVRPDRPTACGPERRVGRRTGCRLAGVDLGAVTGTAANAVPQLSDGLRGTGLGDRSGAGGRSAQDRGGDGRSADRRPHP
ncbi:hypothetical protein ACQ4WX_35745 [Streptomyces lasalocidi]